MPPGTLAVPTPDDIVVLRRTDPAAASAWRLRLREELGGQLADGGASSASRATGEYLVLPPTLADGLAERPGRVVGIVAAMSHPFLSEEWIDAARAIRERHAADGAPISGGGEDQPRRQRRPLRRRTDQQLCRHDVGMLVIELGQLDDPDVTVTTDYETAKSLFLATDPAAGMQAFMAGKLVIQGDMMKLIALPMIAATDAAAQAASEEIRAITRVAVDERYNVASAAARSSTAQAPSLRTLSASSHGRTRCTVPPRTKNVSPLNRHAVDAR